jgi:hypothetical protein
MRYNRLFDEHVYRVENPDGIEPASKYAQTFLRYAGTEIPAATVFDDGKHRVIACGFPLETLTTEGGPGGHAAGLHEIPDSRRIMIGPA